MARHQKISHVIFDVDGLLLDTETLYTEMMHELCNPYGKTFTFDIKLKMMGKKQRDAAQVLIDELQLPITVDDYCRKIDDLMVQVFPNAVLMPGANRLVRHLNKNNIPMALATGSHADEMELKTKNHKDLFSLFEHSVFSSSDPDVKHGKPAPDCFIVAADRFKDKPNTYKECLVFEDAPNGVEGALAADMAVVWVPPHFMDKTQFADKVILQLDSLADFIPEEFGLPPYE